MWIIIPKKLYARCFQNCSEMSQNLKQDSYFSHYHISTEFPQILKSCQTLNPGVVEVFVLHWCNDTLVMVTVVCLTVPLTLPISFHLPDSPEMTGQKCKAHPGQSTLLAGCSAPVPVPTLPRWAPQQTRTPWMGSNTFSCHMPFCSLVKVYLNFQLERFSSFLPFYLLTLSSYKGEPDW